MEIALSHRHGTNVGNQGWHQDKEANGLSTVLLYIMSHLNIPRSSQLYIIYIIYLVRELVALIQPLTVYSIHLSFADVCLHE